LRKIANVVGGQPKKAPGLQSQFTINVKGKTKREMVAPQDRVTPDEVAHMLNELFTEKRMEGESIDDDVDEIFALIENWKLTHAKSKNNQDIENFVQKELSASPPVLIHNAKTAMNLLNTFAKDAKLTQDHLMIIVYTSIDHDFLPDLIIEQTEFLKWFTTDLTNKDASDEAFKKEKITDWVGTTTLAMELVSELHGMQTRH
jgi:hypothetical protein